MEADLISMRALDPQDPAVTCAAVLDALPIVAWIANPAGVVTYLSRGWERYTGNSAHEVLEQGYHVVIDPEDLPRVAATWDAARSAQSSYRDECRIRFADGAYRWMLSQAEPMRTNGGAIVGWFGTLTDIEDRKSAEAALAESESTYRALTATLPGVTWAASPAGELIFVGEGWTALHGKPREDALGESWLEIVHSGDRERVLGVWARSLASGEPYDVQFRLRVTDGSYRWFLVRALPVRDDAESIVRWVGVNVDIDDQRRADEAREQFVRLVENSDDFIGIVDMDGNPVYVNEAGRRMVDIGTIENARATRLLDYFVPEDQMMVESETLPAVHRDGRWMGELRLKNFRTGVPVPISFNAFMLRNDAGDLTGLATVSRDLREQQRIEAGLRMLAETGAAMYGSLDFEGTLRNVAEAVARSFASFCTVDILQPDGAIGSVAASHRDATAVPLLLRAAAARNTNPNHPVARAVYNGESTLFAFPTDWMDTTGIRAAVGDEIDRLDARSAIYVPIRSARDGDVFGALACVRDGSDPRGDYAAGDVPFAEEVAARAGAAFENARAYEREHRIAVTFQDASLPKTLPALEHLHLSADYRPGSTEATIGGDWYDAFLLADGCVALTIGDVLGSGLHAAVTMGKVRQAMRSAATLLPDPNAMLDVADRVIRDEPADTYATALAGIYDPAKRELRFASAGHPGPLLLHADGRAEEFTYEGTMLGLRPAGATGTVTVPARPGSALVFFTDGLVEATRDIEEGFRRLHAAIADPGVAAAENPAHALVEHVLRGRPATDDIAVLVAEIGPGAR